MGKRTSTTALVLATIGAATLAWNCAQSSEEDPGQGQPTHTDGTFDEGECGWGKKTKAADVPDAVVSAFDSSSNGGGAAPEVYEPRADVGLPKDWRTLSLLFRAEDAGWVEVVLSVGASSMRWIGAAKSVASVTSGAWRSAQLPSCMWETAAKAAQQQNAPVAWTIRALGTAQAPTTTATGTIRVLPLATGADVTFWEVVGGKTKIARIKASAAKKQDIVTGDRCVGCHATTPDGEDIIYQIDSAPSPEDGGLGPPDGGLPPPPPLDGGALEAGGPLDAGGMTPAGILQERLAVIHPGDNGTSTTPAYLTDAVKALLADTCLARPSVSTSAWPGQGGTGRWAAVAICGGDSAGSLGLLQLDAPSSPLHVVERRGDTRFAAEPAWSPTGKFLVYTATNTATASAGLPFAEPTSGFDLYRVPVDAAGGIFGGDATKIEGASDPSVGEYHPTVSPDGDLVAFTRSGEIWAAEVAGGRASKIVGDDDPQLTDLFPGPFHNSWPRFTPETVNVAGERYYAIAFSSQRGPGALASRDAPAARMYLAFIKRLADGTLTNVGMVLIPGQTFDADDRTVDTRGLVSVTAAAPVR